MRIITFFIIVRIIIIIIILFRALHRFQPIIAIKPAGKYFKSKLQKIKAIFRLLI